jgi:predicted transcriptional regulator
MTGNALKMYLLFLQHKEMTDIELAKISEIHPNSIRSTRLQLEKMGLICRTNFKKGKKNEVRRNARCGYYTIYKIAKIVDPKKFAMPKKPLNKTSAIRQIQKIKTQLKKMYSDMNKFLEKIS